MFKAIVSREGQIVRERVFSTEPEAFAWKNYLIADHFFGPPGSFDVDIYALNYSERRVIEYRKHDGLKDEAIAEFLFENRSEKLEAYKAIRLKIKADNPKA